MGPGTDCLAVVLNLGARILIGNVIFSMLRNDWVQLVQRLQQACLTGLVPSVQARYVRDLDGVGVINRLVLVDMS